MSLSGEGPVTVAWQPRWLETLPAQGAMTVHPNCAVSYVGHWNLQFDHRWTRPQASQGGRRRRVGEVEQAPIVMSSVGPPSAAACRRTERGVPIVIVSCEMQ